MRELSKIKALCEEYRTEPKLLLVPSGSMKAQIRKMLADSGIDYLNLSITTIKELANDVAGTGIKKDGLSVIDFRETTNVISDSMRDLQQKGSLCFFDNTVITFGICEVVAGSILELFDYGYSLGKVKLDKISNPRKRKDLERIIEQYMAWKEKNACIDHTDTAIRAYEALGVRKPPYAAVCALESCEFTHLEERILGRLGIDTGVADANGESDHDLRLQAKNASFFEAYGEYNEAKEVIRTILSERMPFDSVLIVAPTNEPYAQIFYQLLQQYTCDNDALTAAGEFPITFATGLPLLMSSPAKLLMLLLDWIGSGYKSKEFADIFSSGLFNVQKDQRDSEGKPHEEGETFSKSAVVGVIDRSGLSWQRRSYIPRLEKHLAYIRERHPENIISAKATEWLTKFVTYTFEAIPESGDDGMVDAERLLKSLNGIIERYSRVFSALDVQGLRATLQVLSTTLKDRRVNLGEAIEAIKDHIRSLRVYGEPPSPGRMHFTTYKKAAYIERGNVFVVGLNADKFPGMAIENPLLLDNERVPPMPTSLDTIEKNIKTMTAFLNSVKTNLVCSYSYYDTIELRECFPATLFHRLEEARPGENRKKVEFVVGEGSFIDENDFWIHHRVTNGSVVGGKEPAADATDASVWDPTDREAGMQLSATSLTVYLQCKYKFFLKHILRLKEIKRDDFDALGWLSPVEKGNLYHRILERFILDAISDPGMLKSEETALSHIQRVADEEIAAAEAELPVASIFHTEKQREEIRGDVKKFVLQERDEATVRTAKYAELSFGKNEPITIDLGEGHAIKVSGTIDRVDAIKGGTKGDALEITDYKTGGTWAYRNLKDPMESGLTEANVQLALYYLALKEAMRKGTIGIGGDIGKMSYRFVTEKGDYETKSLTINGDMEEGYKKAFLALCKDMKKGEFPPTKGETVDGDGKGLAADCTFCDYNSVCRFAFAGSEEV